MAAALVERSADHYEGWGQVITFAACTAARIGEVFGVRKADIDRDRWIWTVRRQTTPGPGGLIDKATKGKRARKVPIIEEARELVAARLDVVREPDGRLFTGPRGGRISTAVLRDATHWDEVVTHLGYEHLRRHDLRHTGLTWLERRGVASDATFGNLREDGSVRVAVLAGFRLSRPFGRGHAVFSGVPGRRLREVTACVIQIGCAG